MVVDCESEVREGHELLDDSLAEVFRWLLRVLLLLLLCTAPAVKREVDLIHVDGLVQLVRLFDYVHELGDDDHLELAQDRLGLAGELLHVEEVAGLRDSLLELGEGHGRAERAARRDRLRVAQVLIRVAADRGRLDVERQVDAWLLWQEDHA